MGSNRRGGATTPLEPKILIRPAQEADISAILEIAKQRALNESSETASNSGFLVSDFSRGDYLELLQRAEYFYVACVNSEVAGFILAYSRERIGEDEWLNMQMADNFHDLTVIKQVGVSKAYSGKGIATQLYTRILERAGSGTVIAAVVNDPPNRPSVALHRKMGFQPLTTLTPPDGIPRTVWVRQPADNELLKHQLTLAVDLYKHEDLLNWQKLNNFFYISTGLIAICGFSLAQDGSQRAILISAGLLGFVVSLAFFIALRAGVSYLQARKAAVAFLERNLLGQRNSIIYYGRNFSNNNRQLRRSPTTIVLQTMPLIGTIGWLIVVLLGFAGAFLFRSQDRQKASRSGRNPSFWLQEIRSFRSTALRGAGGHKAVSTAERAGRVRP